MREFCKWLFASREEPFDISVFNIWHILYIIIIVGSTLALGYFLAKRGDNDRRERTLRLLSICLTIVYIADFFIQPLYTSDYSMIVDKLPFHICTLLCPVVAFVQFNSKFEKLREPVTLLAVVAPLMYLTYPGSAIGDISPFCYKVIQTFVYHGLLFSWGVTSLMTRKLVPDIKNWYKSLIGIFMIAAWAMLGNVTYGVAWGDAGGEPHYDWFFLTGSTFPFVPEWLMPFAVIAAVFGMVMIIYGIYYLVIHILNKRAASASVNTEEKETVNV